MRRPKIRRLNSDWRDIYESQIASYPSLDAFLKDRLSYKMPLIDCILRNSKKKILEVGCGTALVSSQLSTLGRSSVALDNSFEMLCLAREFAVTMNATTKFVYGDLRKLPFKIGSFELIFNHGVMEHFTDCNIVKIIDYHLEISKNLLVSVPSIQCTRKILGNERFLPAEKWRVLFGEAGCETAEEFGMCYDGRDEDDIDNALFIAFLLQR